ncbi:C-terminal binding protein [Leucobacter sp. W1038]|uniref:C-terminal binding protein n=1 Tax=Leucobacter sp. W1038 TaxID=3438281 RepID=UPI003D970115
MQPSQYQAPIILVAPHQFPHLDREERLAAELNAELRVATSVEDFQRHLPEATIVMLTPYASVRAEDFSLMSQCRGVIRYGIGYDNIDIGAAKEFGVPVSIVPDASTQEVAFHALTLGLALVRQLPVADATVRSGGWAGNLLMDAPALEELEVGIVGLGRIGMKVARLYAALGARVRGYDPYVDCEFSADLDDIITKSDVLSLHVPASTENSHFLGAKRLSQIRSTAVVVNVSRGALIDEVSLSEALRTGRIGGAGLDVFSSEPLPTDHPLRETPATILTPHIAWRSQRALGALQEAAVLRARQALTGATIADLV